jgi:hypothetical protein
MGFRQRLLVGFAICALSSLLTSAMSCARGRNASGSSTLHGDDFNDVVLPDSVEFRLLTRSVVPRYPASERQAGREASFIAVYLVDTGGRADYRSIRFVHEAPVPFRRAICDYLRQTRFSPVRHNGSLRRVAVIQPFVFGIGESDHRVLPFPDPEPIRDAVQQSPDTELRNILRRYPSCG